MHCRAFTWQYYNMPKAGERQLKPVKLRLVQVLEDGNSEAEISRKMGVSQSVVSARSSISLSAWEGTVRKLFRPEEATPFIE